MRLSCSSQLVYIILVVYLFLLCCPHLSALFIYDQQALLRLWPFKPEPLILGFNRGEIPPLLADIPDHLCHTPLFTFRKKRPRRRGKRAGLQVCIKSLIKSRGFVWPLPHSLDFLHLSKSRCCRWIMPVDTVGLVGTFED